MSILRTRCAFQTEAGGIGSDGQRVELSDRRFEGKGRDHAMGTRVEPRPFTRQEGQPTLIAA